MTRIMALRSAFPTHRYPQAEFTSKVAELAGLGPVQRAQLERLHSNAGVDYRHIVLPLPDYSSLREVGRANDRYIEEATDLGERALRGALEAAGLAGSDLDLLIVTSVTGVAVPSLDARLIPRLGLRPDVKRLPIFGLGCVGGAAPLAGCTITCWPGPIIARRYWRSSCARCAGRLRTSRRRTSWSAACSATGRRLWWSPVGRPAKAPKDWRWSRRAARCIRTAATRWAGGWAPDGFRIVLTPEVADVVERRLSGSVNSFLAEHRLTVEEITAWICHPGGPKIIDAVQNSLKLPDSAVELSRRSLAEVGNLSSVSVLHVLEKTIGADPPPPGSAGLMIGLGPGVSAELVLLQW